MEQQPSEQYPAKPQPTTYQNSIPPSSQLPIFVGIVIVAVIAFAAVIILPQLAAVPRQVEVVNPNTGETITQVSYAARYANLQKSRTADGGFVLGDPNAPVTIVEFADFLCGHCQSYHDTTSQFIDTYVATGKAKFEYRMFPVVSPEFSPFLSQIAECADTVQPGMFWAAHDMLYNLASRRDISLTETPRKVAETLSLDAAQLTACLPTAKQYEIDHALGNQAGVNGTPSVLVRLDETTLGWAYLDGQIRNRGGLPWIALEALMDAEAIRELVIVPEPLLANLVSSEGCTAPCWRGVTAGETAWVDATAALFADRQLLNTQEQHATDGSGAVRVVWESFDGFRGTMTTRDGQIVDQIEVVTRSGYTIGEVLAAQGDPALAVGQEFEGAQTLVRLYYPDKRLVVYVFVNGATAEAFTAESEVVGAAFYATALFDDVMTADNPSLWTGYEGFDTYLQSVATPQPSS